MENKWILFFCIAFALSCGSKYYVRTFETDKGDFFVVYSKNNATISDTTIIPFRYRKIKAQVKKNELNIKFKMFTLNNRKEILHLNYKIFTDSLNKVTIKLIRRKYR